MRKMCCQIRLALNLFKRETYHFDDIKFYEQ